MPKLNFDTLAFNRGIVSAISLARTDVERTRLSAATQTNWLPKTAGPMRLRPGGKYLGSSKSDGLATFIEFVASTLDAALIEISDGVMQVWVDDAVITRPSVSTTISNGSFATSASWTDASTAGGAPTYGGSGLTLNATYLGGIAKVTRQITVSGGDQNVEHALALNVTRGPITFRVGSTSGGDEYVTETTLYTGRHSLAFTPTADFYLTFKSEELVSRIIASIAVEAAGAMALTVPWTADDLSMIRYEQSADVVWVACSGVQQKRIERRGTGRSWSVVEYYSVQGPFLSFPGSTAKFTPAATYGNTTLTASQNFFRSEHVGALFRVFHDGQGGSYTFSAENTPSDVWEVTGISTGTLAGGGNERRTVLVITNLAGSTLTVEKSTEGADTGFRAFVTIGADTTYNVDDIDENSSVWYRLNFVTGDLAGAATPTVTVAYGGGGKDGICRVTGYTSATSVSVEVLSRFSNTIPSPNWVEGYWSDWNGFPSEVLLDGRLYWFGATTMFGSVSDDFANFDDTVEGDSAPIVRTIGRGPVDTVNFALALQRIVIGTAGSEIAVQSSSFDEPLTPDNANTKTVSTQGSAQIRAVAVDQSGIFVQRSGVRAFLLGFDPNKAGYSSQDLSLLVPDLLAAGIAGIAVQRQPDTRIHFWLDDGTVGILTYEDSESVLCWTMYASTAAAGKVRYIAVLPGVSEDQVYYHVERTINGSTVRYLEKLATELESIGAADNWMVDCGVQVTQASSATVSGLSHLEGAQVIAWKSSGSGKDLSPDVAGVQTLYTVSGGAITVTEAVTSIIVGLPYIDKAVSEYSSSYVSTKLAYGAAAGTALTMPKRVDHLGLILGVTHNNGLYSGRSLTELFPLARVVSGREITDVDEIFPATTDIAPEPFSGDMTVDERMCFAGKAPRPCTLMAAIIGIESNDVI